MARTDQGFDGLNQRKKDETNYFAKLQAQMASPGSVPNWAQPNQQQKPTQPTQPTQPSNRQQQQTQQSKPESTWYQNLLATIAPSVMGGTWVNSLNNVNNQATPNITSDPLWREKYASVLMTPNEYATRNTMRMLYNVGELSAPGQASNSVNPLDQAAYKDWVAKAQAASAAGIDISSGSQFAMNNPRPRMFYEPTYREEYVRNLAAPTGYSWTPYGTGYVKNPTVPSLTTQADQTGGGGGGGDQYPYYPYPMYPYPSSDGIKSWYESMVNWNIRKPQGG